MNSFDLIALHRDRYPATHITEETLDTGQDAVDLRLLAQKRFAEIYEQSCLCLFLCLV